MKKKILAAVIVVAAAGILAGVFFQKNPAGEIRGLTEEQVALGQVFVENEDGAPVSVDLTAEDTAQVCGMLSNVKRSDVKKATATQYGENGIYLRKDDGRELLLQKDGEGTYRMTFDDETQKQYTGAYSVTLPGAESFILSRMARRDAADVVRAAVAAENEQDWDTYLMLLTEDERISMAGFLEHEAHQANHSGLLNVKAARIEDMQALPWEENKGAVLQSDVYEESYDEMALYRVSIDYDVYRSDKYYSDGINERLFVLGKRDGQWWLLETPVAP